MKRQKNALILFLSCLSLTGCAGDPGDRGLWMFFLFPLMGIVYVIYGEFTRPRPSTQQKNEITRVKKLYQSQGYTTYHVSVHKPELFFTFLDKGKDVNNGERYKQRIYIDIYKKIAYNEGTGEKHSLPIQF